MRSIGSSNWQAKNSAASHFFETRMGFIPVGDWAREVARTVGVSAICGFCTERNSVLTRRRLLGGAAMLVAAAGLSGGFARADDAVTNGVRPDEALKRILDGNERYVTDAPRNQDYSAGRAARAAAQYPIAAILSCSDSRIAPELVFD
jgi:carbonic anhydrase